MTKQTPGIYFIERQFESGETQHVYLGATSDSQALKKMRAYMQFTHRQHVNAYLCFSRESDGQVGYLNQDGGASPTGKAWSWS